jgi:predicted MPP superfamily phosphohydrolase
MNATHRTIRSRAFGRTLCFAIVSDLHGDDPTPALALLERERPDYILMPGDIFEGLDRTDIEANDSGFLLMQKASAIAPCFFSIGNHENGGVGSWKPGWAKKTGKERGICEENRRRIAESGVILLENTFVLKDGIAFGGLASGLSSDEHVPRTDWLDDFCAVEAPRVLLCHHPEYYKTYLRDRPIDLIVSGHAHGGQWRVFGRGLFAPGQGFFPKYTSGVHDNRLVISTGMKETHSMPRLFNPPEVVFVHVTCER